MRLQSSQATAILRPDVVLRICFPSHSLEHRLSSATQGPPASLLPLEQVMRERESSAVYSSLRSDIPLFPPDSIDHPWYSVGGDTTGCEYQGLVPQLATTAGISAFINKNQYSNPYSGYNFTEL